MLWIHIYPTRNKFYLLNLTKCSVSQSPAQLQFLNSVLNNLLDFFKHVFSIHLASGKRRILFYINCDFFNGTFFIEKARRDLLKLPSLTSCIIEATELSWIDCCLIYSVSCKEASNLHIKINSDGDLVKKSLYILTSWSIFLTVENWDLIFEFICVCQGSVSQHFVWQTYYFCFTRITCALFITNKAGRKMHLLSNSYD